MIIKFLVFFLVVFVQVCPISWLPSGFVCFYWIIISFVFFGRFTVGLDFLGHCFAIFVISSSS